MNNIKDGENTRKANRRAVLKALCDNKIHTRREISKKTGISLMTVGKIYEEFIASGLSQAAEREETARGRHASAIRLSPSSSMKLSYNGKEIFISPNLSDEGEDVVISGIITEESDPFEVTISKKQAMAGYLLLKHPDFCGTLIFPDDELILPISEEKNILEEKERNASSIAKGNIDILISIAKDIMLSKSIAIIGSMCAKEPSVIKLEENEENIIKGAAYLLRDILATE